MKCARRTFALAGFALALAASIGTSPARAADKASDAAALVQKAQATVETFKKSKDFPTLPPLIATAKAVLVFPSVFKAGFVLGGSGGSGVLLVRDDKGGWVGPAFYSIGTASFGLQAGAQSAEVVMVVQSQKALESLYSNKLKLGADASIAVGPKGEGGDVSSDIIAYSTAKGAFAGIAFDGSVLDVRESLNEAYYGKGVTPVDILVKHTAVNPQAEPLRKAMKVGASKL